MKKAFFSALLALSVLICSAQAKFGLFGGPQITSSKYLIKDKKQSNTPKYGFQLGGQFKIPFENRLYFTPSAFYSLKGYKVKLTLPSYPPDRLAVDNNTSIHTFEIAALLQYDFVSKPRHFFIKAGPSIDFQVYGKETFNQKNRNRVSQRMIYSFGEYGRYAANLILQAGYENKSGLILFLQYGHGIGSMNNADNGPQIYHRAFGISIGKYIATSKH